MVLVLCSFSLFNVSCTELKYFHWESNCHRNFPIFSSDLQVVNQDHCSFPSQVVPVRSELLDLLQRGNFLSADLIFPCLFVVFKVCFDFSFHSCYLFFVINSCPDFFTLTPSFIFSDVDNAYF